MRVDATGSLAPLRDEVIGAVGHHRGQVRDRAVVKRGLAQLALPLPRLALAGDQAVAEHHGQRAVHRTLAVVLRVADQDVVDGVGVEDRPQLNRPELELHEVAVLGVGRFEHRQWGAQHAECGLVPGNSGRPASLRM